ncbi:MAG: hypothetical protein QM749_06025 [Aquabacterium sp.]
MRRVLLCLGLVSVLCGLTACGAGGGGSDSASAGGGGGGSGSAITSSSISLPSSVQVVSAH